MARYQAALQPAIELSAELCRAAQIRPEADRVGFEPTVQINPHTAFPMPLLQPLGHLSGTQYCIRMTAIDKPENSSTNPEGTPHEEDPAISARQDSSGVRYGDAALQKRTKQGGQKVKKPHAGPILPPGLVIVDKPIGMTSMTVVAIVRRKAGLKAGHAGTLDPLATGVLVVGIGAATKSLDRFMKTRKAYRTEIDLSAFTATDDREGELEPVEVESPPTAEEITAVLVERFTGVFPQLPPNFSAKKVDGRRAYATARRGETPRLEPRPVEVHEITLVGYEWPIATVEVSCEKGFYVRSLARDLGRVLGTGGHCASIRRTAVGPFTIDEAIDPDLLEDPMPIDAVLPLPEALSRLPQ